MELLLLMPSSLGAPSFLRTQLTSLNKESHRLALSRRTLCFCVGQKAPRTFTNVIRIVSQQKATKVSNSSSTTCWSSQSDSDNPTALDLGVEDFEETGDLNSPWEGAVIYKRNSSVSHVEYCTTLERLGLEKLSTETSKSRASAMGLRVTKAVKDYPLGTPVQISIDVSRKKKRLRLDGILRTVISLGCNRCGEPAAESVYSNFSILLTEEPIEEPEIINMGTIYGEDKSRSSGFGGKENEEYDDESSIDMDDWLYFPPEEKEIDISKHIRDLIHLEITIKAVCNPNCRGLCLRCGTNLNTSTCNCSRSELPKKDLGPLGNLKEKMQQR